MSRKTNKRSVQTVTANERDTAGAGDKSESAPRLMLPARVKRRGDALLHQQCWVWGCDIRRASGNLLLEYGFERSRPPETAEGSSAYRVDLSNDDSVARSLTLWGFGFYYANVRHAGGIFLNRYKFTPKLAEETTLRLPLWKAEQLPALRLPCERGEQERALRLLAEACAFIESYERWVIGVCGAAYRRKCLAQFKHAEFSPPEAIAEWRAIRDECVRVCEKANAANSLQETNSAAYVTGTAQSASASVV